MAILIFERNSIRMKVFKQHSIWFVIISIAMVAVFTIPKIKHQPEQLPNDWFFAQRAYPAGQINHEVYMQTLKQVSEMKQSATDDKVWTFAGPLNTGGRLSDVEFHPDDSVVYLGAASGGVFKIYLDGTNYEAVFDDALSMSVGDIAIAPSNSAVIYVGTGEANCGGGSQTYDGVGVYKSVNGGETWEHMGLEESRNVGRIAVHPENPDIAYVAAMGNLFGDSPERGIYKTSDGGLNWENVLYVSDSTGGIDVVLNPESPDIVYAAMWERVRRPNRRSYGGPTCGIYKSTNGGVNWEELSQGLPSPSNNVGRIGLDICNSDPNVLYAIYADEVGYFEGVYKTDNHGISWTQTNDASLSNCFYSYGWWFGRIEVDPVDPDIAYVIGFDLYKTSNGGNSWSHISNGVHVDQHGVAIDPMNNNRVFLGNDGGYYISENGGNSWDWINILPITQFYTCEIDEQYPERLYGGTQDNGTNRTMSGGLDDWEFIYGGDGFYVLVDPEDNDYVYAEYQYGNLARSTNGGSSFNWAMNGISSDDRKNWNTPVVFDPTNPEILYYGANRLYKSTNRAVNWSAISTDLTNGPGINLTYGTITTISVSPVNPEIIYVGTDDGNVWVSAPNGMGWEYISMELPDRWVSRVAADPWDEDVVYVTFSGYRWDEFLPHIFRSEDKGVTWQDISSDLPESPLNDIIIDQEDNQTLYVASDVGVFVTKNLGESWNIMGTNLPMVPVCDLDIHNGTRKLLAATYGRSMYTYDLYQDTLSTSIYDPVALGKVDVEVFPNPVNANSYVRITTNQPEKAFVFISDLAGNRITDLYQGVLVKGQNRLALKPAIDLNLKSGIYFITVIIGKGNSTGKFILLPAN